MLKNRGRGCGATSRFDNFAETALIKTDARNAVPINPMMVMGMRVLMDMGFWKRHEILSYE